MNLEAHLTVEDIHLTDEDLPWSRAMDDILERGRSRGWSPSFIQDDIDLGPGTRLHFTKHGTDEIALIEDLTSLQKDLTRTWDLKVTRKKVERIIYDVRP